MFANKLWKESYNALVTLLFTVAGNAKGSIGILSTSRNVLCDRIGMVDQARNEGGKHRLEALLLRDR